MSKFFDIIPPNNYNYKPSKKEAKEDNPVSELVPEVDCFKKEGETKELNKKILNQQIDFNSNSIFKSKQILLICSTIILLIVSYCILTFRLSKVSIVIYPENREIDLKTNFFMKTNITSSNFSSSTLMAKVIKVEKNLTKNFNATGKVEQKAEGTVRLYNNFTTKT